jgi:hypothetical protein
MNGFERALGMIRNPLTGLKMVALAGLGLVVLGVRDKVKARVNAFIDDKIGTKSRD